MKEPETAIISFTDGKLLGPDNIPNEIFTKSTKATRAMYLTVLRIRMLKSTAFRGYFRQNNGAYAS